jgi:hypothetical protein
VSKRGNDLASMLGVPQSHAWPRRRREHRCGLSLSGESLAHLQCVTRQCLKLWPPVQVRSAAVRPPKAAGVLGTLSILRRVKGNLYQVMLDRHPLYFYSGDRVGESPRRSRSSRATIPLAPRPSAFAGARCD